MLLTQMHPLNMYSIRDTNFNSTMYPIRQAAKTSMKW